MSNFGNRRFRGRGGFGGGRGRSRGRGNFTNFGGSNFEPCNLRDIFKDRDVNSFEEPVEPDKFCKQRLKEPRVTNGHDAHAADAGKGKNVKIRFEVDTESSTAPEADTKDPKPPKNHKKNSSKQKLQKNKSENQSYEDTNFENEHSDYGSLEHKKSENNFSKQNKSEKRSYANWENEQSDWRGVETSKSTSFQTDEDDCPFPKLNDKAKQYFKRVYDQLSSTFDNAEDEEIFFNNVMEETVGQEAFLATTKLGSRCLELIILKCKNVKVIRRFVEAYSNDLGLICVDLGATHVTQALLITCLRLIQNKDEYELTEEDCKFFENWIVKITECIIENLDQFVFHEANSTYVIRTLLSVLCGKSVESGILRRVLPTNIKNDTVNFDYSDTPTSFKGLFKKLSKKFMKSEHLHYLIKSETGSPIIQVLLAASRGRYPKICQKFIKTIAKNFFNREKNDSISKIFSNQYGSYVAERVLESANPEKRLWLWENFIDDQFNNLCVDSRGNFFIQKLIKTCSDKEEFEKIFDRIEPLLSDIFDLGYSGVFSNLSEMCKVLDVCQAKLIKTLMTVHQCNEPVERQEEFATLLLCSKTYEEFHKSKNPNFIITLGGCLIVQNILWFHKPHKVVMSLLNMKDENLVLLGCNKFGSHVYDALFKSSFVGEKKRDLILKKLQPHLIKLACDVYGSRCIDAIWAISNIKTKVSIADELLKSESVLKNDRFGRIIFRNLALHNFNSRKEEWKQFQNINMKKRKMFDDIIGDVAEVKEKIKKES